MNNGLSGGILEALYELYWYLYYIFAVEKKLKRILTKYSPFYSSLLTKQAFEDKVWEFIRFTKFDGRKGQPITLTIKTIIASHAIQLSFNLSDEAYDYWDRILIYKDYYLSRVTNRYHKAEVNPGFKLIVFSVRAIYESISKSDDGLNVLLHEFAHALWLEHKLMSNQYSVFDSRIFDTVEARIEAEMQFSQANETHFFRKYAFTNKAEFFAVAVENLFERPEPFRNAMPAFYELLATLFQQDPIELKNTSTPAAVENYK
jgi:MtfA peptidase